MVTNQVGNKQDTVEVVHEALIRHWEKFRKWMDEDRDFRTWQQGFRADLKRWQEMNQDEGALLRGAPLAVATERLVERHANLTEIEQNFINASLKQQHQQERQRKLIFAVAIATVIIMTILAIFAFK